MSIGANQVHAIFMDRDRNFWLGTFGGGLNKISAADINSNRIKFKRYVNNQKDPFSISDNRVMTIYEDSMNNLWVGTYGGGVQKFNRQTEKFTQFNKRNRINSSVVYGIIEDDQRPGQAQSLSRFG